ncbi:TBC1 domain, member 5 [Lobosporangium transversale]|nr:TBC1 domain, member 5 [Lobosporangium transversale]
MSRAKPWYEFSDDTMVSRKPKIPNANSHTQLFGRAESPEPTPGKQTPVIEWSRKIFYYLEKIDNELYLHLKNLDIQPQLFGIRWFRLLFGREFPMEDVLTIWDGIFAQDPNLEICIFIGLALLLRIRDDLLQEDFAGCLHKLMRYPSVKDVHLFISQGLSLQKQPNAIGGLEVIRQNNALTGKPLPPLPYESDSEHAGHDHLQQRHQRSGVSPTYTQQSHHHQKQDHQQQQSYPYDHAKGQNPSFSGSGVFSQHLPPAALDAIKPVAEGFVHVTKNVLESKGGAALNKALSDMKKNTQSYIRKVNSPVQSPSPSPFPPIFDQANVPSSRLVASTQPVHHSPMEQEYQDANGSNTVGFTDKQLQLQLGQIVAKAMAILETELRTPDQSNSVLMMPSKATQAAMSGLEHVRDFLLGSSKDLDLLVIESKMLETSTNINDESGVHEVAHSTTKPTLPSPNASTQTDTRSGTTTKVQRKPINAIAATTRINSPTPIRAESPRRSSSDLHSQRGSLSRTLSHSSAIGTEFSADRGYKYDQNTPPVTPPIAKSYVPSPPSSLSAPKPFSFDDLIDDTTTTGPVRSSSPSISATKGVGSSNLGYKVKSPRSSLVNSQFSWMLNDDNSISSSSSSNITKTASPSASISSLPKSGASSGVQRSTPDTFSPSPTPSHRINIDPLAGNVSKQNVSASSAATSGITITHQQLQEDDPLRL